MKKENVRISPLGAFRVVRRFVLTPDMTPLEDRLRKYGPEILNHAIGGIPEDVNKRRLPEYVKSVILQCQRVYDGFSPEEIRMLEMLIKYDGSDKGREEILELTSGLNPESELVKEAHGIIGVERPKPSRYNQDSLFTSY